MKKSQHSQEAIIGMLKEGQAGGKTSEICPRHGISAATYYKWKQKYGGMEISEAKRMKALEEENCKLKKLVAEQALDSMVLKELLSKKH